MRWFGFAVDVAALREWYEVVEGEGLCVEVWEVHVYGLSAYPADGFFGVFGEVSALSGDFVFPGA